ncbi:adenosine deaminase [Modestobacter versicolor]|uniref:Adenine deaminase n=1 Tax=Modestobacter versicolor TaxID=429133 RepID=A0A323V4W9_9ACTN|nr:adenosine deaminase [Modestobacter versicolor]MBB3676457.1 adenosine deaminase [Modestobacter versicolor]PZA19541.1 adenosine deaminase [Modestobacter versicolor]
MHPSSDPPALPTAELHVHVEGTLEPELALDLARRNGVRLRHPDLASLRRAYSFADLPSFLDLYYELTAVLREPQDFTDLAEAYLARAAAQAVRHAEVFVDPQAHTSRGVPLEVVLDGLAEAFGTAEERHGLSARVIVSFLRDRDPREADALVPRLRPWHGLVIGVGLDSAEVGFPPEPFARAYALAADEGLHRVAHAGEEGPPAYVTGALDALGVERVDHGIRSLEDPSLVARLREEQVPLTVCPLSNVALRAVPDLAVHPLARMLDAGLRVSVNSDDPAYFGGYLHDNTAAVSRALGLTAAQRRQLAEDGFRASFLPDADKARHLAAVAAADAG